jgi:hypothetical protein
MAHAAMAPTAHQGGPLKDPLEQAPPRSRAHASLGRATPRSRGCAYLGRAPPRSRVRSALERAPPRSRALRTRAPAPVRGFQCPDNRGAAPSCAWGTRPGAVAPTFQEGTHPRHCEELCGVAGASPVTPRRLPRYG